MGSSFVCKFETLMPTERSPCWRRARNGMVVLVGLQTLAHPSGPWRERAWSLSSCILQPTFSSKAVCKWALHSLEHVYLRNVFITWGNILIQDVPYGLSGHRTNASFGKNGDTGAIWFSVDLSAYFTHITREILLLVPLSFRGVALGLSTNGTKILLFLLPISLAK